MGSSEHRFNCSFFIFALGTEFEGQKWQVYLLLNVIGSCDHFEQKMTNECLHTIVGFILRDHMHACNM
jgi:hypothetical protein